MSNINRVRLFCKSLMFNIVILNISNVHASDIWSRINYTPSPSIANIPIKVAVVDDSFDINHPLLSRNLDPYGFNARDKAFDPNVSIVVDQRRYQGATYVDHGTHVAGIVSRVYNKDNAIVPVKIGQNKGESNTEFSETLKNACTYLASRSDISIINISNSFWKADDDNLYNWLEFLAKKGKMFVLSAGNDGNTFTNQRHVKRILQSTTLKDHIIIVGASAQDTTTNREVLANFSDKAGTLHDYFITAPGTNITSAIPQGNNPLGIGKKSGTSMAAPLVAGILARLVNETGCSVATARKALFLTADRPTPNSYSYQGIYGHGILNYSKAKFYLTNLAQPVIQPIGTGAVHGQYISLPTLGIQQPAPVVAFYTPQISFDSIKHVCAQTGCTLRSNQEKFLFAAWQQFNAMHDKKTFFSTLDNLVTQKKILGRHAQAIKKCIDC